MTDQTKTTREREEAQAAAIAQVNQQAKKTRAEHYGVKPTEDEANKS